MTARDYGLDFLKSAQLCRAEMYGDWYRDPWGWAEILWAKEEPSKLPLDELLKKTKDGVEIRNTPEFSPLQVPKSLLGIRPAVVMSADAHLLYLASIASVAPKLHANLPEWVHGWRIRGNDFIAHNSNEWRQYLNQFSLDGARGWVLKTDITSFFASVNVENVATLLSTQLGKCAPATVTGSILRAHDTLLSHSGLPQRSYGSAIIANSLLRPVDDLIVRSLEKGKISKAVRWMDDIYLFGDEGPLFALNLELHQRMRQLGLELNASKSDLLPAAELAREFDLEKIEEIETPPIEVDAPSGVTVAVQLDTSKVLDLEERILADPQIWSRHVVRLALRGLKDNYEFDKAGHWLTVIGKLPHHADSIGRYLRDAVHFPYSDLSWDRLESWFNDFVASPWASIPWVQAQAALTFDSTLAASSVLKSRLTEWLEKSNDIQLVAIAIQRLGMVDSGLVRDVVRARIDNVTSPLMLRNFALGLMAVNEERTLVRKILGRDPRNILLTSMFESKGYRPLSVIKDFDHAEGD
ncbi:RNA-directed DNA polymerase [Microtetraspora sp. AC03309]|uniref:RNA-directed DNA polymerase n=1 Tax=Microtetraspora sp. AC03309 TaxID=2779376 RepID=UPI001E407418|nr:RNA-directed DNA polymerase [Microtetraspora sp. AC03309]MCC5579580.1 RNA-directed DNA polymerase [Microtetraspora sp. AC03309]